MKKTILARWAGMLALMLALVVVGLQLQSAQAQYEYSSPQVAEGGSATSMVERGGFLYIVQGSTLHKVREKDLAVVGRTVLRPLIVIYGTPVPTATTTPVPTATPQQNGTQ